MGLGSFHRQLGLEALPRIKPWPGPHAGPNDAEPNAGADDAEPNAGADDPGTVASVPASSDATILRKLLKLV